MNTQNVQFLPLRKATNIPVTFKGDSPLFFNLGGQASQKGGVKGRELESDKPILAIANVKNLLRITIWAEEFFHGGVDLNPLSTVHSPQSTLGSRMLFGLMLVI